jgi:hypothetical protein
LKPLAKIFAEKVIQNQALFQSGHSMSAKYSQKYMKTQLSKDFGDSALKSLKKKTVKKLSTVSSTIAA